MRQCARHKERVRAGENDIVSGNQRRKRETVSEDVGRLHYPGGRPHYSDDAVR